MTTVRVQTNLAFSTHGSNRNTNHTIGKGIPHDFKWFTNCGRVCGCAWRCGTRLSKGRIWMLDCCMGSNINMLKIALVFCIMSRTCGLGITWCLVYSVRALGPFYRCVRSLHNIITLPRPNLSTSCLQQNVSHGTCTHAFCYLDVKAETETNHWTKHNYNCGYILCSYIYLSITCHVIV